MIYINVLFLLIAIIILTFSVSGFGKLVTNKFQSDFFLDFFFGFIIISLIITFIHFFFQIYLLVNFIILTIGLILFFKKKNLNFIKIDIKNFIIYFSIFLIFIPMFLSQKYHEDFGYYHLPYIINFTSEKIIFGLGNLNDGFIHNSIWLNVLSLFYFENNYNFVNLPTFLLYSFFIIYSFNLIINSNKNNASSYFLIICIFYFILKFTRISEFGNDIPSLIYSILGIFFFLKYEEENDLAKKKFIYFTHLSLVVFAVLIKFSVMPLLILPFFIFIRDFRVIIKEIFRFNYFIIYFLVILFFAQQFIYTGCFIFPSKITCLNVSWFNSEFLNLQSKIELINKSFSVARDFISSDEYLLNFNWVPYWFKRNYLEITEHLLTMFIPIIIFLFLSKNNIKRIDSINYLKSLIFFLVIGFIFWFTFSPVYRFGILYFLCLFFILTVQFYKKKIFPKKIFLSLLSLFLIFNFTKNVNRINQKNYIFFGIEGISNEYLLYDNYIENKMISVFKPNIEANNLKGNGWQGRLCWDIPFMCSYKKIEVNVINDYYVINKTE